MTGCHYLLSVALLASFLPLAQSPGQVRQVQKLEQKFVSEKDPVNRAKALAKLLPREIDEAAAEIRGGNTSAGISRLQHYRDVARQVHQALLGMGRLPAKKPEGFMQLQIALRESLRRLSDLLFLIPLGQRDPVEVVRSDLSLLNSQLLQELFPPPAPRKKK